MKSLPHQNYAELHKNLENPALAQVRNARRDYIVGVGRQSRRLHRLGSSQVLKNGPFITGIMQKRSGWW